MQARSVIFQIRFPFRTISLCKNPPVRVLFPQTGGAALNFLRKSIKTGWRIVFNLTVTITLLMFSLGIIGYYLAKIYDEVKRRPRYVIAETLDDAP